MRLACNHCQAPVGEADHLCRSCGSDLGYPNVRRADSTEEVAALSERERNTRKISAAADQEPAYNAFLEAMEEQSGVVVSVPAHVARNLVLDPASIYQNYETLVEAGLRSSADSWNDQRRFSIGGWLFGKFANRIVYGALTLTGQGLATYGDIHFRLRPVAIEKRVSFLEFNSYTAAARFGTSSPFPLGKRASWCRRHWLAAVKIGDRIRAKQGINEWQTLLLVSDGKSREADDYIEAHVYGGFNVHAVDSVTTTDLRFLSHQTRLDARVVIEQFQLHTSTRSY